MIDGVSARRVKRIVCFHPDVDFGVTTHLEARLLVGHDESERTEVTVLAAPRASRCLEAREIVDL